MVEGVIELFRIGPVAVPKAGISRVLPNGSYLQALSTEAETFRDEDAEAVRQ